MKWVKRSPLGWLCVMQSCVLSLLTSSVVSGEINTSSEIQVAGSATFQASPAVASDAAGNLYVAVWQKQVAGGWEVFARRYTLSRGSLVPGPEFQVNTVTAGCQVLPAVVADFNGNFVVVWQSDQDPGGGTGVYAL